MELASCGSEKWKSESEVEREEGRGGGKGGELRRRNDVRFSSLCLSLALSQLDTESTE
jgi:hypothetical protein